MRILFFETPLFSRLLPKYLDDESYRALQQVLLRQPETGPIIPGSGGFRKLRWHDTRRRKGRRGGLRIIYYFLENLDQIWLFTLYSKDEVEDLTPKQCQLLRKAIQAELKARNADR